MVPVVASLVASLLYSEKNAVLCSKTYGHALIESRALEFADLQFATCEIYFPIEHVRVYVYL